MTKYPMFWTPECPEFFPSFSSSPTHLFWLWDIWILISPRMTDPIPKAGCQNLSTHLSFCQTSLAVGSFLLFQKGATPSFLLSHTDQNLRGRVKAPSRTGSAQTGATVTVVQVSCSQLPHMQTTAFFWCLQPDICWLFFLSGELRPPSQTKCQQNNRF